MQDTIGHIVLMWRKLLKSLASDAGVLTWSELWTRRCSENQTELIRREKNGRQRSCNTANVKVTRLDTSMIG